jgi:hypothetical protein
MQCLGRAGCDGESGDSRFWILHFCRELLVELAVDDSSVRYARLSIADVEPLAVDGIRRDVIHIELQAHRLRLGGQVGDSELEGERAPDGVRSGRRRVSAWSGRREDAQVVGVSFTREDSHRICNKNGKRGSQGADEQVCLGCTGCHCFLPLNAAELDSLPVAYCECWYVTSQGHPLTSRTPVR